MDEDRRTHLRLVRGNLSGRPRPSLPGLGRRTRSSTAHCLSVTSQRPLILTSEFQSTSTISALGAKIYPKTRFTIYEQVLDLSGELT